MSVGSGVAWAADATTRKADETLKTSAAVIAVDKHWGEAELAGDNAYLDELLLPQYRTVDPSGVAHGKSRGARKPATPQEQARAKHWLATHAIEANVVISGDTAVLTWYDPSLGPERGVRSCDIFVYQGGHWHALYSQHSDASKE
jgi:hypothetical protein